MLTHLNSPRWRHFISLLVPIVIGCMGYAMAQVVATSKVCQTKVEIRQAQPSAQASIGGQYDARAQVRLTSSVTNQQQRKYEETVLTAVQKCWWSLLDQRATPPAAGTNIIEFKLRSDGAVTDLRQVQNSGSEVLDKLCESAIRNPAPFGKWP